MSNFEWIYVILTAFLLVSGFTILIVAFYFTKFNYKAIWELDTYGYGEVRPLLLYTAWVYTWQRLAYVSSALIKPSGTKRKYGRIINLWEAPVPRIYKQLLVLMDIMALVSVVVVIILGVMSYFLPS